MRPNAPNPDPDLSSLPGASYLALVSLAAFVVFVGQLLFSIEVAVALAALGAAALPALATVQIARRARDRESVPEPLVDRERAGVTVERGD